MHISTLFQIVAKNPKPPPLATDQYEFTIDRAARRVVRIFDILSVLSTRETMRVQTNRPFTWTGRTKLPDTSLGVLRAIPCQINVDGTLPPSEDATRALLGRLLQDGLDFDLLFGRAVAKAVTDQRVALQGAFVDSLRSRTDAVQSPIAASMRLAGLPIDRVTLQAISYDTRNSLDLVDETDGISIRTCDSLAANRVTYKARLIWGKAAEHVLARLAYNGTIEGKTQGAFLERPLVAGQIQPLEAFFRQLLTEALGNESLASIIAGEAAMHECVKTTVSERLGRGTGRVVDTLVIYSVITNLPRQAEISSQFRERYRIMGIRGEGLEIEHAFRFALVDRDRWLAQKSPEPEAFLRQQIVEATKVFLHDKRFEDVVGLYLEQDGEGRLSNAVASRVAPIAATIGYRLVSTSVILAIPEHDFIDGRQITLPEQHYQLADPNLQPLMRLNVTVRVHDGAAFARALARQDDFGAQIRSAVEQTVRTTLRRRNALDYYGSPYVNGIAVPRTGDAISWRTTAPEDDPFSSTLRDSLDRMLRQRFGLALTRLGLEPGDDPIIARMKGLANLPIQYQGTFLFKRGDRATTIQMNVTVTIFITGLAAEHWSSFYHSVPRQSTTKDHVDEIRSMLTQTLRTLEHVLVKNDRSGLQSRAVHRQVVGLFTARLREEYGLEARLRPLALSVYRPGSDRTASLLVDELHKELEVLLLRRRTLADTTSSDAEYERESLTKRISLVRGELDNETKRREAEIAETETVEVEQDLITGEIKLLSNPDADLLPPSSA